MEQKYYALERTDRKAGLYIFGNISSYPWREKDRDAYGIVKELQELEADEIHVHINSNGGSVAEGLAIYNVLKSHNAKVYTYNNGFACSAASVIFMAGDERVAFTASLFMFHHAWSSAQGNAAEFRKQADALDTITQASVKAYMEKITISKEELMNLMDNEIWVSSEKALEYGFATKIYEEKSEGANQSVMSIICDKLLSKTNQKKIVPVQYDQITIPSAKEIAQEVYNLIQSKSITNETKNENAGSPWAAFFGGNNEI